MVSSLKELGPEKDCADKGQQHIQKTVQSSRQKGRPTKKQDRNCQAVINIWSDLLICGSAVFLASESLVAHDHILLSQI
jgi:hypothetical protein